VNGAYLDSLYWVPDTQVDLIRLKTDLTLYKDTPKIFDPKGGTTEVRLWREREGFIGVPRQYGVLRFGPDFVDNRSVSPDINIPFTGSIGGPGFEFQPSAIDSAVRGLQERPSGGLVLQAPCGTGKTTMGIAIASRLRQHTLVIVHKEFLADQWAERLTSTGLEERAIGRVQGRTCTFRGRKVVIAMLQSLLARDYGEEFRHWAGLVIADETHRLGAVEWCKVIYDLPAKYRLGLSATPTRSDGLERAFLWHIGPVDVIVSASRMKPKVVRFLLPQYCPLIRKGKLPLASVMISRLAGSGTDDQDRTIEKPNTGSVKRSVVIVHEIVQAAKAGRKILVLSDRIPHLRNMMMQVHGWLPDVTQARYAAGLDPEQREQVSKAQIIWATYGMCREGLDIPELDTAVLALPKGDVEQIVGRIMRICSTKRHPLVMDFVDPVPPFTRMAERRCDYYEQNGFEIEEVSRGDG
jgi:superfamily II DNA or RNA helicase